MLQKVSFLPGFNKQVTATGAEGQWTGGDFVRFRYGTPEKIGGWDQLGEHKLTGAGRALHHFDDNAGIKYAAIGTNRILYIYSGVPYLKRTLSPPVHCPSAPVAVTCLLKPGKKLTFCSIENSVSTTNILDLSGDQLHSLALMEIKSILSLEC